MENNQTPVVIDKDILAAKKEAWSKIGEAFYTNEIQLQAESQAVILGIKTPTTIHEVTEFGEAELKKLKQAEKTITEKRKAITDRLRTPMERLSLPEKTFAKPIQELSAVILKIKQDHEADLAKVEKKNKELSSVREIAVKHLADATAHYKKKILDQITSSHKCALDENVTLDKIKEYVDKCANKFTLMDFTVSNPVITPIYATKEEVEAILSEVIVLDANNFIEQYRDDLKKKFEFYEIDFNNKEDAIKQSIIATQNATAEIVEEKNNQQMSATLEHLATPVFNTGTHKALKKKYQIQMTDDIKGAITIMAAFTANLSLCQPKLRIKSMLKLSVDQMATALEAVKNDDNGFSVTGINFVQIDKL